MKRKTLFLAYAVCAGMAASIVVGCKSSSQGGASNAGGASAGSKTSNTTTQKVEFLFVQNAKDVSFENGTMTLHDVSPVTTCFADRPERIAGHMRTEKIVPMWSEGKNSFTADPPNATLSILSEPGSLTPTGPGTGTGVSDVVVVLRNPRISGNDLTYDVQTLEGTLPAKGGACSLFIDIIGMPLTPFSYAGAARRAARHGYMYPGYYGPAVVPVPVAVAPVPVRPAVIY
jgi:hypothetical protein